MANENEEAMNDDFLSKLADPSTNIEESIKPKNENRSEENPTNGRPIAESHPVKNESSEIEDVDESNVEDNNVESTETEEKRDDLVYNDKKLERIHSDEKAVPDDVKEEQKKETKTKPEKEVKVISASEYEMKEKNKDKPIIPKEVSISDDNENKIREINEEILNTSDIENAADDIMNEPVDSFIHSNYETEGEEKEKEIVFVNSEKEESNEKKQLLEDNELNKKRIHVYGGDGVTTSFKNRSSKVSKILKNINIDDTNSLDPVDISKKNINEQESIYLKTVLPTLKPSYSVVPLIVSGVVITMTAFMWTDVIEIVKIEEKSNDFDPSDDDYIYNKNKLFLEKRRKELDLFYQHIYSVSGYPVKPSQDELFGKIIKFPDFQQLFFAAYSASFQKEYTINITCGVCGNDQPRSIHPKKLCFLLNKNINIDKLTHYITKGAAIATEDDSINLFKEFQSEKLVEGANSVYRTKEPLKNTAIVFSLKIPSIYDAYESFDEIVENFKDKELEMIYDNGDAVSVDSNFALPKSIAELRAYAYVNSLIVANPVESKEDPNKVEVGFIEFKDKKDIINTIKNLSLSDYKQFISDPNLNQLIKVVGITHAIDAGKCENKNCGNDMGIIQCEPEKLFFMTAERELPE